MNFHFYFTFIAALIPLFVGFIWYNPKVFGKAWMKASDMTEEKAKGANMILMFSLTYLFSLFAAFSLIGLTIHQLSVFSIFANDPTAMDPTSEAGGILKTVFEKYGSNFRTFKHGAFHGVIISLLLILPVIGTNAIFERRGFKYIAINLGYWMISMALMGGLICACL